MIFYTTYFAQAKKLAGSPNLVAISRGVPLGFPGRNIKELAPSSDLLWGRKEGNIDVPEFEEEFSNQLSKLNVDSVVQELGDGAVLVCWEKRGAFCHRHLVADWLRKAGHEVQELIL